MFNLPEVNMFCYVLFYKFKSFISVEKTLLNVYDASFNLEMIHIITKITIFIIDNSTGLNFAI